MASYTFEIETTEKLEEGRKGRKRRVWNAGVRSERLSGALAVGLGVGTTERVAIERAVSDLLGAL